MSERFVGKVRFFDLFRDHGFVQALNGAQFFIPSNQVLRLERGSLIFFKVREANDRENKPVAVQIRLANQEESIRASGIVSFFSYFFHNLDCDQNILFSSNLFRSILTQPLKEL